MDVVTGLNDSRDGNCFGSHFWTLCLLWTREMTAEEGWAVGNGRHSCFGFDIFLGTHCWCGGSWGNGLLEDFVSFCWVVVCRLAVGVLLVCRRDLGTQAQYKSTWWTCDLGNHLCWSLTCCKLQVVLGGRNYGGFLIDFGDCVGKVMGSFGIHLDSIPDIFGCCDFGIHFQTCCFVCFVALIGLCVVVDLLVFLL